MQVERDLTLKIIEDPLGFNYLTRMIRTKIGLDCAHYRDKYLKRRVNLKMKEKGYKSYSEYGRVIKDDPEEFDELIKFITVNYTKFYRDRDVWDEFNEGVLPSVLQKKKTIRVLSAGCSTGEEPYTLAILLKEKMDKTPHKQMVSVKAVDIDTRVLAEAQEGVYPPEAVVDLSRIYLNKYFTEDDGLYRVNDEIKKMVRFGRQDITKKMTQRFFDIVFCRNVFIYFTNEAKAKIITNFHEALNSDGYLILGKTEMMPQEVRGMYKAINNRTKIFQKIPYAS